jgi:hypothetical protein
MRDRPAHGENEDKARDIEADQELAQGQKRAGAELTDREGNGAEHADRRRPHHDGDDAEKHLRGRPDQIGERLAGLPHRTQRETAQHRDEQHLQHVAFGECADEGVGNDGEQKFRRGAAVGLRQIRRDRCSVDMRQVDIHAGAGREGIHGDETERQRERRQHLEIDQRLERDAPDFGHIGHVGDAMHNRAENNGRDQNADRLDEGVAEQLHAHAGIRIEVTERDAEHHRDEHQKPKLQVEWLRALALDCAGRDCLIHVRPTRSRRIVVARRFIAVRYIRSESPGTKSAKQERPRTGRPCRISLFHEKQRAPRTAGVRRAQASYSCEISCPV